MFSGFSAYPQPGALANAKVSAFGTDNTLCDDTEMKGGSVKFGSSNIVHPKARIRNEGGGAIVFGSNNIVEEGVLIVNRSAETLHIGSDNLFEVGSIFEGWGMGDGCVLEPRARVLPGASLGNNCVVGAQCSTWENEQLANDTVIYGGGDGLRRIQTARSREQAVVHAKHIEYLKDVLKRFHPQKAGITQSIGVVS
ncbi:hypothetical protein BC830DRAFT_1167337 [Chytriomyces sp. MP71]|nr:hypothetical protein BC830DRAFT_1167337 [Chytriomyces sp. MP71]